jgi:thioredoxin 1
MEVEPRSFYRTGRIAEQARTKLEGARQKGEPIDYVTFVPDGEPTLDANFGAPWCGPCRMVSPIYDKLSKEYDGRFKFCKINVDENQGTARKYQIMSIPMQMFFADGQKVDETLGAVPEALIRPKVEALVYSRTRTWLTSTK